MAHGSTVINREHLDSISTKPLGMYTITKQTKPFVLYLLACNMNSTSNKWERKSWSTTNLNYQLNIGPLLMNFGLKMWSDRLWRIRCSLTAETTNLIQCGAQSTLSSAWLLLSLDLTRITPFTTHAKHFNTNIVRDTTCRLQRVVNS